MAANPRLYFDYAAATPVDPRVIKAMLPYFGSKFGNPGSLHSFGQEAMSAVDQARTVIANSVSVNFRDIIFTASATEANNLILRGTIANLREKKNSESTRIPNHIPHSTFYIPKIIVSAVEHESILETAKNLADSGEVELVILPVDKNGIVNLKKLEQELDEHTVLVSIMYANNETGVIQPISEIADIIRNFRNELRIKSNVGPTQFVSPSSLRAQRSNLPTTNDRMIASDYLAMTQMRKSSNELRMNRSVIRNSYFVLPAFHTDASQAFQFLDCSPEKLGVDFITLSSHKIYGPKGAAALIATSDRQQETRKPNLYSLRPTRYPLSPILTGGHQEFNLRAGTENVPAIVGFAKATELILANREIESIRLASLKEHLYRGLKKLSPRISINGPSLPHSTFHIPHSIPSILNLHFPGQPAEELLTRLDLAGLAVSSGSACSARSAEPSHVLLAMGQSQKHARESLRFSLGRPTTLEDIRQTLKILSKIL